MARVVLGVSAIIADDDRPDTVLLVQRARGNIVEGGKWSLPGGTVEPGEHIFAALQRELREELGVEITYAQLLGAFHVPSRGIFFRPVMFLVRINRPLQLQRSELDDAAWVPLREAIRMSLAFDQQHILRTLV